jgi:plasmid stabilization system protein ParE
MARLIWTERAVSDLDEIAEYIAFDDPAAARRLVRRLDAHLDQLKDHPLSGPVPPEFASGQYRQISENPCRVIYRFDGQIIIVLRVIRSERMLRPGYIDDLE